MRLKVLRPVPSKFKISSPFGLRVLGGQPRQHNGVDFAVPVETPIMAVVDGSVERAGWENKDDPKQGFGLRVMQRFSLDGIKYFAFYGHCNKLLVKDGDSIKAGQIIALSGNTGKTTGPHLHLGARKADTGEFFDFEFISNEGPSLI